MTFEQLIEYFAVASIRNEETDEKYNTCPQQLGIETSVSREFEIREDSGNACLEYSYR